MAGNHTIFSAHGILAKHRTLAISTRCPVQEETPWSVPTAFRPSDLVPCIGRFNQLSKDSSHNLKLAGIAAGAHTKAALRRVRAGAYHASPFFIANRMHTLVGYALQPPQRVANLPIAEERAPPPGPRRPPNTDISVRACGPVRSAAHVGSVCSPRSQPVHHPATRTG